MDMDAIMHGQYVCIFTRRFIACTNLLEEQPDHAARLARFAIAAVRAAEQTLIHPDKPEK